MTRIEELLTFVYGEVAASSIYPRIKQLIADYSTAPPHNLTAPQQFFDQTDALLITYGDMVQAAGEVPLQTLRRFLEKQIAGIVKGVHILPFYPYSSDDGFSVIDYAKVNRELGEWEDIEAFRDSFRLMFDAVINHISQESDWFKAFKLDQHPYTDYFTIANPDEDYSAVFRPRTLPLLTPVETPSGTKHVWTTFSADQIDLNFASPDLLLDMLRILLTYAQKGAALIRLDAIGFMWKELGTSCIHLPQTHALIQLMRAVFDEAAPQVALVSETNVPHKDNISYFGNGRNEAQMVYNFSLPPLLLHTFHTGSAKALAVWAAHNLAQPSTATTFFNFCASHDGIGLTPARGILTDAEITSIASRVESLGGLVSYKTNSDGTNSAYELNINYLDALGDPTQIEDDELRARRFLCSQSIMLALRGVPGIYFHSLFGSRSWHEGVEQTGRNRTINREKLQLERLEAELQNGLRKLVFDGYCKMLRVRSAEKAFHPNSKQSVSSSRDLFSLTRSIDDVHICCTHNVTDKAIRVHAPVQKGERIIFQLIDDDTIRDGDTLILKPYQAIWQKWLT